MEPVLQFTFLPSASLWSRHWKKKKAFFPSAWTSSWAFWSSDDFSFNDISLISWKGSMSSGATGTFLLCFLGGDSTSESLSVPASGTTPALAGFLSLVPLGARIWACAIRHCSLETLLTYERSVNWKSLFPRSPSLFYVNNENEMSSRHIPSKSGS